MHQVRCLSMGDTQDQLAIDPVESLVAFIFGVHKLTAEQEASVRLDCVIIDCDKRKVLLPTDTNILPLPNASKLYVLSRSRSLLTLHRSNNLTRTT
jgi:hypothetical protein